MSTVKIEGKIIRGAGYGRVLGFPTANIDRRQYVRDDLNIKLGVWAGEAEFRLKAKSYKLKAAVVIGPIDHRRLPKLEAYLIGFKGNLYGQKIEIILRKYIRPFKKFKSESELKLQIAKDVKIISKKITL